MRKIAFRLLVGVVLLLSTSALRVADAQEGMNTTLSQFGFVSTKPIVGKPCVIESTLIEADYLSSIPMLKKVGILNPDITQTYINMKPRLLESAFVLEMAPNVVRSVFDEDARVTACQSRQILSDVDDYGNDRKRLMFSYEFDSATYKKVNWDKFDPRKFRNIASGFKFEIWFMQETSEELGQ
jgi:hypothetical protein